jgi:Tfp pilus assembly pilus retraction ATPase PilT
MCVCMHAHTLTFVYVCERERLNKYKYREKLAHMMRCVKSKIPKSNRVQSRLETQKELWLKSKSRLLA